MSWSAKSAICASSAPERTIQFVPSVLAGFADLMGFQRHLLDDQVRTGALIQAINAIVKPGDSVIDLGTGTGILAMAAARAGAARVYALEHNSIVNSAQVLARENGLAAKIEFLRMDSHEFCLAEKADVIVSECFGLLGVGGTMFAALSDLIRRNLKPAGIVMPAALTIHLAPVDSRFHYDYVHCWEPRYGFSYESLRQLAVNNLYLATFSESDFLAEAREAASIDILRDLPDGRLNLTATFESNREARFHGYCGWFNADLGGGVRLGTGPASPPQIWRQLYFPLQKEIFLAPGGKVDLSLSVLQGLTPGAPMSFYWKTRAIDSSGQAHCFVQSTLKSFPSGSLTAAPTQI